MKTKAKEMIIEIDLTEELTKKVSSIQNKKVCLLSEDEKLMYLLQLGAQSITRK